MEKGQNGEIKQGQIVEKNMEGESGRTGEQRHLTGGLWRLMTSSCQSSSHRESRALPSVPKLMGRRQGGEVIQPRAPGTVKEWR